MEISDRIRKVIDHFGYSPSEFADSIEVPRSSISHITSGRNKASLDFIIKIKNRFPEIAWDWLIYGKGEMIEQDSQIPKEKELPPTREEKKPHAYQETSLPRPDLFTWASNFGGPLLSDIEEINKQSEPSESNASIKDSATKILSDSQPLGTEKTDSMSQKTDCQEKRIKKIIFFFEDGKFEVFTP
ncbi:helix-turn-helix domain-containing protein [Elizabethkingia argentiflava]|uniref:Helix-turn-helix domain-containing protein n=1 Tax=Elizabethkingia argenteiflava TaxID=2681556 RepID=A0A845PWY4_9FLAO|nr:helix-turn-helix transcriptional regulator [Elizabethkingia argenteiflava]NAW52145.1 helix-turn-helix domain-containing protein [Elizabethkingia argenteiflava]